MARLPFDCGRSFYIYPRAFRSPGKTAASCRWRIEMRLAAKISQMIAPTLIWSGAVERHFAEAARNIEHVARLAKAREFSAQFIDELLAFSDRQAKMRGAACKVRVVE